VKSPVKPKKFKGVAEIIAEKRKNGKIPSFMLEVERIQKSIEK